MWSAATITALCTGVAGVLGAVASLVALFRHVSNPSAHAAAQHAVPAPRPARRRAGSRDRDR